MRFKAFGIFLFLALPAMPVLSQTIEVRSGEHENFTRLVVRIPAQAGWSFIQERKKAYLAIEREGLTFDTSSVFERIPKTRLSQISQEAPGQPLVLTLTCNCLIRSFEEAGGYAVIDITDSQLEEIPSNTQQNFTTKVKESQDPSPQKMLPLGVTSETPVDTSTLSISDIRHQTRQRSNRPDPSSEGEAAENIVSPTHSSESVLQEQIIRATSQGLLEIDGSKHPSDPPVDSGSSEPNNFSSNVRAQTAVDRDVGSLGNPNLASESITECIEEAKIDISSWGDDNPFGHQIGAHRTEIAGEFDELSISELKDLAKKYLYFGFGNEANSVIKIIKSQGEGVEALSALATLMKGKLPSSENPFSNQTHCDTIAALWSVIATEIKEGMEVNTQAVARSFAALPDHLRHQFAPILMTRFAESGDTNTANLIQRVMNRSSSTINTEIQLAEAQIARTEERHHTADNVLEMVARSNSKESPAALVELIDRKYETREPIEHDTIDLLGSYWLQFRHADIGAPLNHAIAVSQALDGNFHEAFMTLTSGDPELVQTPTEKVLTLLTENADDVTFLEYSLKTFGENSAKYSASLQVDMAERLLVVGFPERALEILNRPAIGRMPDNAPFVRAEASLALGLPRKALLELVSETGERANELKAKALESIGSYDEATKMYSNDSEPEDVDRLNWMAGIPSEGEENPERFHTRKQGARDRLIELDQYSGSATLKSARALLEQARALREDVAILNE